MGNFSRAVLVVKICLFTFIQFQLLERDSVDDDLEGLKKELSGRAKVLKFFPISRESYFVKH